MMYILENDYDDLRTIPKSNYEFIYSVIGKKKRLIKITANGDDVSEYILNRFFVVVNYRLSGKLKRFEHLGYDGYYFDDFSKSISDVPFLLMKKYGGE